MQLANLAQTDSEQRHVRQSTDAAMSLHASAKDGLAKGKSVRVLSVSMRHVLL